MSDVRELAWRLATEGFDSAISSVSKLDNKISKSKASMRSFGDTFKNMGSGLTSIGNKFIGFGDKLGKIGSKVTKFTMPLSIGGGFAFKWAKDVDSAIRQVSTLTSDEILPVSKIKNEVRSLSDESGRSQAEIANAMYEALSSGVDESKVVDFTKSAINLAEAGFTDMSTAIDATTTVLNAYGENAFDVTKISDIFVKTQDKGKITVDELGKSIGRVIPTAAAAGVNVDQLGAAYSVLTSKGMNARIATTNLDGMLSELSQTGSKTDEVLRLRTGKSFEQLTKSGVNLGEVLEIINKAAVEQGLTLKDMFSQSTAGSAALSLLSDGVKGYTDMLNVMNHSEGATGSNADKVKGMAYNWSRAMTRIKNVAIDFGDAIAPVLIPIVEKVAELIKGFSNLSPEMKSSIVEWGLMAVAAGPAITIFSKVSTVIGFLFNVIGGLIQGFGMLSNVVLPAIGSAFSFLITPIGLVVSAIGAVIGIGIHLYKNWAKIKERAKELGGGLKGYLGAALESVGGLFIGLWNKAKSAFAGIKSGWEKLKNFLAHPIKGTIGFINKTFGGGKEDVPSHATGLNKVPYNDYYAKLHSGEMVLTRNVADEYRRLGGTKNSMPVYNVRNNNSNVRYGGSPNVTINIDVKGSTDNSTAVNIARAVRDEVRTIFRNLSLQRV